MATTTNYGWTTPDDTALVKDGASAIRTLGSSIDTTLKAQIDAQIPDSLLTTTGDIIYASGASTPARRAIGSSGDILTVSGGLPVWSAPTAAGSMTLISTTTLSGSSITLSSISASYKNLYLVIRNFLPASSGGQILLRLNGDTGTRYGTVTSVAANNNGFGGTYGYAWVDNSNTVGSGITTLLIPDYANTVTWKMAIADQFIVNSTTATNWNYRRSMNAFNQTGAISSIGLGCENVSVGGYASGTFTSGTVLLYGVN